MQSQPMCESFRIHTHFTSSKFLKSQQPFGKKTDLSTHQFLDHVERSTLANNYSDSAIGGGERDRTDDLMLAKHALSQLSYTPSCFDKPRDAALLAPRILQYASSLPPCLACLSKPA